MFSFLHQSHDSMRMLDNGAKPEDQSNSLHLHAARNIALEVNLIEE